MKRMFILFVAFLCLASPLFSQIDKANNCLNRKEAVTLLLEDASGIEIDPVHSNVWSPYVDFGFGPGFEGLLPAGTQIDPAYLGIEPFPGETIELDQPAYFFWIDDEAININFIHATRFVLLSFECGDQASQPVFSVSQQGWWPVITQPNGDTKSYFELDYDRVSDLPAAYNNPDGLVLGTGIPSGSLSLSGLPILNIESDINATTYGLVVRGSGDSQFGHDVNRFCQGLTNDLGVPQGNIVKSNGGGVTNLNQLDAAIMALCNLGAGNCTKIYVRILM